MNWFRKKWFQVRVLLIGSYIGADHEDIRGITTATAGSIGGIAINDGNISAPKFTLSAAGSIEAVDATITGTLQTANGTGQRAVLDGVDNSFKFYDETDLKVHISSGITDPLGNVDSGMVVYGAGGAQNMIMGGGIIAHDGTNTIGLTGSQILIATPSSFYTGQTITKVVDGVTFQFVNGILVS